MDNKVLKTYEFHLKNNTIYCFKKKSLSKAVRSLKNLNINLHSIDKCYSDNKRIPQIYLYKIIRKFDGKETS